MDDRAPAGLPLFAELKRRRVFRALVGYGIAAFAVLQIIEPIIHGFRWPDAVLSFTVVALAAGFPIVVSLAWIFDVNAGRIERTAPGPLKRAHVALILGAIAVLAAAPGVVWYFAVRSKPQAEPARSASIAVLPFANLSGGQENEYFSDGVTEEIINALANVDGVRVVARTSAFSYKGKNVNVRQIGEELNVATVLEGSVRRERNELRVVAQLISAADGYHLWSKTYDRELKGVFSLEDELARAIVQALKPKLVPAAALVQQSTSSSEAHDLYLRGRYFWNQRNKEAFSKAAALFEQAIAVDPGYALAWSGLADCQTLSIDYALARARDVLPKARAKALKALELDGSLAEAHTSFGAVLQREYDWAGAEREFRRAIELKPGFASAHHWYGGLLRAMGRTAEADAEVERARQLDPTSGIIIANIAAIAFAERDYAKAIAEAKKAVELSPNLANGELVLAQALVRNGNYDEALAVVERSSADAAPLFRAQVLASTGEREKARAIVAEFERRGGSGLLRNGALAQTYLALGDKDRAFFYLDRAVVERNQIIFGLKISPVWDEIRSDPRYHELLKRVHLE